MNERKKITEKLTRTDIREKIKIALQNKPTQSYLQSMGVQTNKEEELRKKIVRNGKNRKRFSLNRPQTIKEYELDLNSVPAISYDCEEFKTPPWFRNSKKVDVSIIIPMYKSKDVVLDLIKNWKIECDLTYEIIFVDDCCPEKSKNFVLNAWAVRKEELKNNIGKIISNKANGGYGAACNNGASFAQGEYLIFLNADTLVTKKWIEPMIELFKDQKVGLVGNLQLKKGGALENTIDSAGSEWRWGDNSFVHIGRHSYNKKQIDTPYTIENAPADMLVTAEREMVTGCCFAMPKTLFDYIGGFNPNYKIGYWEDSEICMNVKELGYKIMFTSKSVIYHKLGHTSSGGHKYMQANMKYFKNKWVNSGRLHKVLNLPEDKPKVETILIKRTHAHGDTLVAAGVCSALKKEYPGVKIIFSTIHSDVVANNPYIDEFVDISKIKNVKYDVFYNLDLS
ncbi:MAG: glycosyltransferase, partial [bacterium]